ncbi:hypothetical protein B0H13DRAFT_1864540 [Mycena leptocephala]|nr:hypothetical protein B0H13DRAFT_1864540 [Mycena leptocephala]
MPSLCVPIYAPDPGDEDKAQHTGGFYAIVSHRWKGVVTSKDTLRRALLKFPDGSTFEAKTWEEITAAWDDYFLEQDESDNEPVARSCSPPPSPSPPSTPTDLAVSRTPSPSPSPTNDEISQIAAEARRLAHIDGFMAEEAQAAADKARANNKLTRDELQFLANNRPPPVPLSPQRARQQFERVLGADAVATALASIAVAPAPVAAGNGDNDGPPRLEYSDGRPATPTPPGNGDNDGAPRLEYSDGRPATLTPPGARFNGHLRNCQIAALGEAGARFVETEHGVVLVWVDPEIQQQRQTRAEQSGT